MNKIFLPNSLNPRYVCTRIKCVATGLRFVPPNYAFFDKILQGGIAIDVGVGDNPDFALLLTNEYKIESLVVDPTLRHRSALKSFERKHPLTRYLPFALGAKNELRTFYESQSNISGSLRKDHKNVQNDHLSIYDVQVVTLNRLLQECGSKSITIMKIDIEGEEYEFINSVSKSDILRVAQLLIEFHHNIVESYSIADTHRAIRLIEKMGMKSILYNGRDCLFYWGN